MIYFAHATDDGGAHHKPQPTPSTETGLSDPIFIVAAIAVLIIGITIALLVQRKSKSKK